MSGLVVKNTERFIGEVEILGTGKFAVPIARPGGQWVALAGGVRKVAYMKGELVPSLDEQLGRPKMVGVDRSTVYVLDDEPAIVLAMDVKPHPTAVVPKADLDAVNSKLLIANGKLVSARNLAGSIRQRAIDIENL